MWFPTLAFAVCTLLAQVVLTVRSECVVIVQRHSINCRGHYHRIYVVTMKNIPITIGFIIISAAQLVLGIWAIVLVVSGGKAKPAT